MIKSELMVCAFRSWPSFSSFISYSRVGPPSSPSASTYWPPTPTFPLTSSAFPTFLLFLSCSISFFLAPAAHVLSSCLANGNRMTSELQGSDFPGKIQFALAMYSHINHSEAFIYKMWIRGRLERFPRSDRWHFASRSSSPLAEALRDVFSLLNSI